MKIDRVYEFSQSVRHHLSVRLYSVVRENQSWFSVDLMEAVLGAGRAS